MKRQFQLPSWMLFRFFQIRHAVQAQFPDSMALNSHLVEKLLTAHIIDRPLSSIYLRLIVYNDSKTDQLFQKWYQDLPTPTREDWDAGIQQYLSPMVKVSS